MTATKVYPTHRHPTRMVERCAAEIERHDGTIARCGNWVAQGRGELCWRHR